ncbi:MAG: DHH family phosphoesterase, partial [Treponema sp.]|nr:DHH family phosphoesterase [Treponema sp.]
MKNCTKLPVTKNQIEPLCSKYNINQILASIFIRRGISQGEDILYFLENDIRFQHSPFCFSVMEDIVERILQAQEEGEKVLIFGDSDVDGITSTAILYSYLKKIGIDVQWKLPVGDDGYGLSIQAIDDFAKEDGSLIITVDCGISNFESIEHANDLQIDVIVTDHHNPQETLPEALLILDPKLPDSNYPFMDISGAAVAYKLVSALRFAKSPFYNTDICILDVQEDSENQCYNIDCLKVRNLNQKKELHQKIIPGVTSISQTKLPDFLSGNYIYVWDKKRVSTLLRQLFGSGIDFNLCDLQEEISKLMPVFRTKSVEDLYKLSSFTKYFPESSSYLSAIFNLYVTYVKKFIYQKNPIDFTDEKRDLQLVTLAALAD